MHITAQFSPSGCYYINNVAANSNTASLNFFKKLVIISTDNFWFTVSYLILWLMIMKNYCYAQHFSRVKRM